MTRWRVFQHHCRALLASGILFAGCRIGEPALSPEQAIAPDSVVSPEAAMIPRRTTPEPTPVASAAPVRRVIGRSVEDRPIEAITFAGSGESVLILAGTHGDEPKSVYVAQRLVELLTEQPELASGRQVTIVPEVNPDGCTQGTRRNANKVDLNRNFPTADWTHGNPRSRYYSGPSAASEPETRALAALVEELRPARIVSIHSIGRHRFCNNYNGPASAMAELMSGLNGYPVTADIGYPTPGSFGTWAGHERQIPTITLELPSHHSRERCWKDNEPALLAFIAGLSPALAPAQSPGQGG